MPQALVSLRYWYLLLSYLIKYSCACTRWHLRSSPLRIRRREQREPY